MAQIFGQGGNGNRQLSREDASSRNVLARLAMRLVSGLEKIRRCGEAVVAKERANQVLLLG